MPSERAPQPDSPLAAPHVYIVVPVHNRVSYTMRCLESLGRQSYEALTVIVVDDGSTDDTSRVLSLDFTEAVTLPANGTLWWSGATNLGISWVLDRCQPNDFVLTLNNDTTVRPEYVATLVDLATSIERVLIGSVAVDSNDPDRIVDGGPVVRWSTAKGWSINAGRKLSACRAEGIRFVEPTFLPGRGALIPVSCFRDVGLFDAARLPQYAADYEFSHRAACAGYRLLMSYEAPVLSVVEATGVSTKHRRLPWARFLAMFFSRRSPACLVYRWRFARLAAPKHLLPAYLLIDTLRVIGGGIRDQMKRGRPK